MKYRQFERNVYLFDRALRTAHAAQRGPQALATTLLKRRYHRTVINQLRKLGAW